jgi:hypothetical protein
MQLNESINKRQVKHVHIGDILIYFLKSLTLVLHGHFSAFGRMGKKFHTLNI